MEKRRYHYVNNPKEYDITCGLCGGSNIEWSEFRHLIWCYDCKKDTKGSGGIFSGPIAIHTAQILGYNFSLYDINQKKILPFDSKEWDDVMKKKTIVTPTKKTLRAQ